MNLPDRVLKSIRSGGLLRGGEHVLAAVSGGADSVAMLHLLNVLSARLGISLSVAHLNHKLRGREAARDAKFVRELARKLDLPFSESSCDVKKLAKQKGISVEMAAREARYGFFSEALKASGADCVAVAHNADDQAETVLLKLARGSVAGLGGMKAISRVSGLCVIRPLLDVTHAEAVQYLKRRRLEWIEDSSNAETEYLRNRVRHEIIPLIEKRLNPQFRKAVLQVADIVARDQQWLDDLAQNLLKKCSVRGGLSVSKIKKLSLAARRRVLMLWLQPDGGATYDMLQRIEEMISSEQGSEWIPGPSGRKICRNYDVLSLMRKSSVAAYDKPVKVPGITVLKKPGLRISVEKCRVLHKQTGGKPGKYPAWACINPSVLKGRKLHVRSWRPGDRFCPLGFAGTKKIQDIYVDAKVPQDARRGLPLLVAGDEIIWVPGYRVARSAAVTDPSRGALLMRIEASGLEI